MNAMEKFSKKGGIVAKIKYLIQRCRKKYATLTEGTIRIQDGCVRIPCSGAVVEICLGGAVGKILHLQPDVLPEGHTSKTHDDEEWPAYWIVDKERVSAGVGGFLRLEPKQDLILGRHALEQRGMFDYSTQVADRHLSILHHGDYLQLTDLGSDGGSCISLLPYPSLDHCLPSLRHSQFQRLADLFFMPLSSEGNKPEMATTLLQGDGITRPLPRTEAMECLTQAHKVVRTAFSHVLPCSMKPCEDKKKKNSVLAKASKAPTLVHLSADTTPVIIGDLHAKVDNLLTILTTGCLLTSLENGTVTLVFLGDAIHPDETGQLSEMKGSMLIMDLILTLMARFPGRVVYLRGNHDGFSEDIYKGQVCQGQQWNRALIETRGKAYRNAMKAFYRDLPYVAVHPQLLATHAAPPVVKVTREKLADLRNHNELIHQLTWNRMNRPSRPGGYREKDIKNFRNLFDLPKDTAFVVGHTTLDNKNTAWLHAGAMHHHHILYSASAERVGWIICLPNGLVHLECPVIHQPGMVP